MLTETSSLIDLSQTYPYTWQTTELIQDNTIPKNYYKPKENRVTIWSKYPGGNRVDTFNNSTAICQEIITPTGNLLVYGTIIGVHGNRKETFKLDLNLQLKDFDKLYQMGNFCIAGDLNISFSDEYYYTKEGRQLLYESFERNKMDILTTDIKENIDHIVISQEFIGGKDTIIHTWNDDKKMSDHIGVMVDVSINNLQVTQL